MIEQLPEKYRVAVKRSEIEGKTRKEVARRENISLSGAKSRVQKGFSGSIPGIKARRKTRSHGYCRNRCVAGEPQK
ncbi:MAG: sigma factor-like helix-turn-helix DNA-binding protein [Nitrospiria bacterium]